MARFAAGASSPRYGNFEAGNALPDLMTEAEQMFKRAIDMEQGSGSAGHPDSTKMYEAFLRLAFRAAKGWQQMISDQSPVHNYMGQVGNATWEIRPLIAQLVKLLGPRNLHPPPGLIEILRPLTFFLSLEESAFAAPHMDSSFGQTWMPSWRASNLTGEMMDVAAFDELFKRALGELAAGMKEVVPGVNGGLGVARSFLSCGMEHSRVILRTTKWMCQWARTWSLWWASRLTKSGLSSASA